MPIRRLVPLLLFCVSASGCAVMYELLVPAQKRWARESAEVKKLTEEAWRAKDCEAGVTKLNGVSNPRVRRSVGNHLTPFGEEVKRWWMFCVQQASATVAVAQGDPLPRLEKAVKLTDLALTLPIAELGLEDKFKKGEPSVERAQELSVARVTELKQAFSAQLEKTNAERAAQRAEAERRAGFARNAEQKGWHLAALAAWQVVAPVDDAGRAERAEALARVSPAARAQLAVPVALLPSNTGGASPEVLSAVRADASLRGRPDLVLVEDPGAATVVVRLGLGPVATQRRQESVRQQHTWISGRKTVPNPAIESTRKQLAYHEKEAIYWRNSASRVRCSSEPCKTRISALNNVKREEEAAVRQRRRLSQEKPTVVREVTSVHQFNATRTILSATCQVSAAPSLKGAQAPALEGAARVERAGLTYAAAPRVGLAARADPLPGGPEMDSLVREAAVRELVARVAHVPALAAAEFDARLVASTEPLERVQYAVLKALRSTQPGDVTSARAAVSSTVGAAPDWARLQEALEGAPLATR